MWIIPLATIVLLASACGVGKASAPEGGATQGIHLPATACDNRTPVNWLDFQIGSVTTQTPGKQALVPGNPMSVLQCEYSPKGLLVRRQESPAATAGRLAAGMDSGGIIPPAHPQSCPVDDNAVDIVTFRYAGAANVVIAHMLSGCHLNVSFASNPALFATTTPQAAALLLGETA